jgi:CheY-like chemotaxis protein
MTIQKNTIVAVLSDLMFTVKIQDAAKRAGLPVMFVKSREKALEQVVQHSPANIAVIILDLNDQTAQPLDLITALKADPASAAIPLLGFVSHVQADLIQSAREKGCDTVMARSGFSQDLPAILQRYAAAPA